MIRTAALRVAILLIALAVAYTGCSRDSATAPSSLPQIVQGTVALEVFQLAVVNFRVDRAGSLSSRVDWNNSANDIDTALVRGHCTVAQILAEVAGCNEAAAIATDDSFNKPSVLSPSVQPGDHTLVIFNFGPAADTSTYRLEGSVSGATSPTSSARRTDTFAFTLPAGSPSVVVGPIRAGNGPLEVALDFSGNFIILACVGMPGGGCRPMGGRPTTTTFTIPSDFPAGTIQASVYFNPVAVQPSGNANGTVTFTYNPF
jgi:hypothetical protein